MRIIFGTPHVFSAAIFLSKFSDIEQKTEYRRALFGVYLIWGRGFRRIFRHLRAASPMNTDWNAFCVRKASEKFVQH